MYTRVILIIVDEHSKMNYHLNNTLIKSHEDETNNSSQSPPPESLGFTTFSPSMMGHDCGESYSTTTSTTITGSMSDADLLSPSLPLDSPENNSESDEASVMSRGTFDNSNANIYSFSHCPFDWDGILCWPRTLVGETASLPCMETLHGIPYNTSSSATRVCEIRGIWNKTDYLNCKHILSPIQNVTHEGSQFELDITSERMYLVGYCLSLTALICAAFIFLTFKELRCLRNTIHSHLVITYILHDALWVICLISSVHGKSEKHGTACVTFILLHYFYLTNFFWMFVEGLYLYVLVVQTFMAESIKLRTYCFIGWGIPLLVVASWCIVRLLTMNSHGNMKVDVNPLPVLTDLDPNVVSCPWLHENAYDWIHKSSALLVLAANMVFLLQIMWVLITKLRSATTPETQQSRKATKAMVVLMPLLGITYILILIGPSTVPLYEHIRAFLISTQGFLVALFYCFLNQEVRFAWRHRWARIRDVGPNWMCCSCETETERRQNLHQMRDWSPRSRTESIRLYTPTGSNFRKRESSASETTTMTAVLGSFNGNSGQQGQSVIMTTAGGTRRVSSTPLQSCRSSNLNMNEDTAFV